MAWGLLERTLAHKLHINKGRTQEVLGTLDEKVPGCPRQQSRWRLKGSDDQILPPQKLPNANFQVTHKIT